jgi:hypothetical protein
MTDKDADALHALAELFRVWRAQRVAPELTGAGTIVILANDDHGCSRRLRKPVWPGSAAVFRFPNGERLTP